RLHAGHRARPEDSECVERPRRSEDETRNARRSDRGLEALPRGRPGPSASPGGASRDRAARSPARPAMKLGRYEVVSELGRGGMGVVYEARAEGETFAVKLLMQTDP